MCVNNQTHLNGSKEFHVSRWMEEGWGLGYNELDRI